ncbi:MAG: orotate phosphoribosyltransferase [Candidatus Berkiellales bacterium]
MEGYQKTFIELALKHQVLKFGEFKLKSGRMSPYFFNVGQFNTGEALNTLGNCYAAAIAEADFSFDVIFGPAYKGIPLACSAAISLSLNHHQDVPYAFNRKETKDHGEGGQVIGASLNQQRVLIIDDVITAGTAIRESLDIIQGANGKVAGIVIALDRQEKGQGEKSAIQEIQAALNIPIKAIITFENIMEYVGNSGSFAAFQTPLNAYRQQYGIS